MSFEEGCLSNVKLYAVLHITVPFCTPNILTYKKDTECGTKEYTSSPAINAINLSITRFMNHSRLNC